MVQLFSPKKSTSTDGFIKSLPDRLQGIPIQACGTMDEVKQDQPLLLLVQMSEHIEEDLNQATADLKGMPTDMVGIIILHVKARRAALPKRRSVDTLEDKKYETQYGLVVDIAYHNGSIYDKQFNTDGINLLGAFLKKYVTDNTNDTVTSVDGTNACAPPTPQHAPVSSQNVQLFVHMDPVSLIGFQQALQLKLQNVDMEVCTRPEDILPTKPLLVVLQNMTDSEEDIINATYTLNGISNPLVAVVVVHAKDSCDLPQSLTKDRLSDARFADFGLIIDMAYNNEDIYDHPINKDGIKGLSEFIGKYSEGDSVKRAPDPDRIARLPDPQNIAEKNDIKNSQQLASARIPMQYCQSSSLTISQDLDDLIKMVQEPLGLEVHIVKLLQLSERCPWQIVCMEGDYVHQAVEEIKDTFINPKIIIVLSPTDPNPVTTKDGESWFEIKMKMESVKMAEGAVQTAVQKFVKLVN